MENTRDEKVKFRQRQYKNGYGPLNNTDVCENEWIHTCNKPVRRSSTEQGEPMVR